MGEETIYALRDETHHVRSVVPPSRTVPRPVRFLRQHTLCSGYLIGSPRTVFIGCR